MRSCSGFAGVLMIARIASADQLQVARKASQVVFSWRQSNMDRDGSGSGSEDPDGKESKANKAKISTTQSIGEPDSTKSKANKKAKISTTQSTLNALEAVKKKKSEKKVASEPVKITGKKCKGDEATEQFNAAQEKCLKKCVVKVDLDSDALHTQAEADSKTFKDELKKLYGEDLKKAAATYLQSVACYLDCSYDGVTCATDEEKETNCKASSKFFDNFFAKMLKGEEFGGVATPKWCEGDHPPPPNDNPEQENGRSPQRRKKNQSGAQQENAKKEKKKDKSGTVPICGSHALVVLAVVLSAAFSLATLS